MADKQYWEIGLETDPDTGIFTYNVWAEDEDEAATILNAILNGIPQDITPELVDALTIGPRHYSTLRMLQKNGEQRSIRIEPAAPTAV